MEIQLTEEDIKSRIITEVVNSVKQEIMEEVKRMEWNVREELKKEILQQYLTGWATKELNQEFKNLLNKEVTEALSNLVQEKILSYVDSEKRNIDSCILKAIDEKAEKVLKGFVFVHSSSLP